MRQCPGDFPIIFGDAGRVHALLDLEPEYLFKDTLTECSTTGARGPFSRADANN
jgi:hypothetical protein